MSEIDWAYLLLGATLIIALAMMWDDWRNGRYDD